VTFAGGAGDVASASAGIDVEIVTVVADPPAAVPPVGVSVTAAGRSRIAALALGAEAASGDILCFLPTPAEPLAPEWLARLVSALAGDVVAATPTLVHPGRPRRRATEHDWLVRSAGFDIDVDGSGTPEVVARHAGARADVRAEAVAVAAAPLHCLVVNRSAYLEAGGLEGADLDDVAGVSLCVRLRRRGGRVVHIPAAVAFDGRPVRSRPALRRPVEGGTSEWRALVEAHGPWLVRRWAGRAGIGIAPPPRWVITTAAPSAKIARLWGDWHLAVGLAEALRRLDQDVVVQSHDLADALGTRSRDIHLVLRGLFPVRRTPGQRHVLWVISHPETLGVAECDAADLVLVASHRFAAHLRTRTSTPVEEFLQATDPGRFRPGPVDPGHQHPVTVVAKTRGVLRQSVADALAAGLRPAIYGSGWQGLVDPSLVVAEHVGNEMLPNVYRSAGVVLNDHWDTMKAWGFVSNRLFDVLACGTPVISDDVDGIGDLFGDGVPTYAGSPALGDLVRAVLADPDGARAAAARARSRVLAHHTFDHRARQLLDLLDTHGLSDACP
jgi:glycosyltransferase involved in cell wall biosynthesis